MWDAVVWWSMQEVRADANTNDYQNLSCDDPMPVQKKDRDGWVEGKPGLVALRTIQFLDASGCMYGIMPSTTPKKLAEFPI